MLTRKTQYAWMVMGGLICLFGLALACKLRDGNRAVAQGDKPPASPSIDKEDKDLPPPPPPPAPETKAPDAKPTAGFNSVVPFTPEKVLAPKDKASKKDVDKPKDAVEPKAVLGTPSSVEPHPVLPPPSAPKLIGGPPAAPPPPATSPGLILPASFGPNTPTPKDMKKDDPKDGKKDEKPKGSPLPAYVPDPQPPIDSEKADNPPPVKPAPIPTTGTPLKTGPFSAVPPVYGETKVAPTSYAPTAATGPSGLHGPDHEAKVQPGEPPLAPAPGPVQLYHVHGPETLQDIARRTLGSGERWTDLQKLNPTLKPDTPLSTGTTVRLPGDACVQADEAEPVKPLPSLRPKPAPPKAKVLPLTGTYQCSLDEKGQLTLPRALRDQLAGSDTVLISPGPDRCLWLTNQPHLERLAERLEQSQANEMDVRVFKRLYYAQTEKLPVNGDGRISLPERLAQFAGLHQELVLVGIDDHFEVWDAARWRQYTQQKGAAVTHSTALSDSE